MKILMFCHVIILLCIFKESYASLHGIPPDRLSLLSSNEVDVLNKNRLRVTRQTLGYQSRDSTDIVVLSPGTNQGYRGVPTTANIGQTVVVSVPNDNYGRRYIATLSREPRMNH